MSRSQLWNDQSDSGWTFVEAIIVISIVILLTGTVAVSASRYVDRARIAAASAQVEAIRLALFAYYLDVGTYPTEAQGLMALSEKPSLLPVSPRWNGPYLDGEANLDPWGNHYDYLQPGRGGHAFEVVSYGSDGRPGGEGILGDISSISTDRRW